MCVVLHCGLTALNINRSKTPLQNNNIITCIKFKCNYSPLIKNIEDDGLLKDLSTVHILDFGKNITFTVYNKIFLEICILELSLKSICLQKIISSEISTGKLPEVIR